MEERIKLLRAILKYTEESSERNSKAGDKKTARRQIAEVYLLKTVLSILTNDDVFNEYAVIYAKEMDEER